MEYGAAPSNACYGDDGAPALPREARRRRRDLRAGGLTLLGTAAALAAVAGLSGVGLSLIHI